MRLLAMNTVHLIKPLQNTPWGRTLCGRERPLNDSRIRDGSAGEVTCRTCLAVMVREGLSTRGGSHD